MKTQQECWEAMFSGETLINNTTDNEFRVVNGWLVNSDDQHVRLWFDNPGNWRIKPKKLPFVEALRALVNGECRVIGKECGTQIAGHSCFDELLPSDFDAEWELVK